MKSYQSTLIRDTILDPEKYGLLTSSNVLINIFETFDALQIINETHFWEGRKELALLLKISQRNNFQSRFRNFCLRKLQKVYRLMPFIEIYNYLSPTYGAKNIKLHKELASCLISALVYISYWNDLNRGTNILGSTITTTNLVNFTRRHSQNWEIAYSFARDSGYQLQWLDKFDKLPFDCTQETNIEGANEKSLYIDSNQKFWLCKYDTECLLNPILASILASLLKCPGNDLVQVRLTQDPYNGKLCSIQNYLIGAGDVTIDEYNCSDKNFYKKLLQNSPRKAVQLACQAVTEWLLGNVDGLQIVSTQKDIVFIDHDRAFFYDDGKRLHRNTLQSIIMACLSFEDVLPQLQEYLNRIKAFPTPIFQGFLSRSTPKANKFMPWLYSLPFDDTTHEEMHKFDRHCKEIASRKKDIIELILSLI